MIAFLPMVALQPAGQVHAASSANLNPRPTERKNPKAAIKHLQEIYADIGFYRQAHGGIFPTNLGPNSLTADIASNPRRYGLPDWNADNATQANDILKSPGSPFVNYFLHTKRPDGTPFDTTKPPGTRDILAYTNAYVYRDGQSRKTRGFYLVLWGSGAVQKIAAERILATPAYDLISADPAATGQARQQGEKQIAFPGQAGLPGKL